MHVIHDFLQLQFSMLLKLLGENLWRQNATLNNGKINFAVTKAGIQLSFR